MLWRWLKAVLLLPGMVLGVIPACILYFGGYTGHTPSWWAICAALCMGGVGVFLAGWTVWLFYTQGQGTAAPWDPPKNFVLQGPYLHTRNPMITAVFLLLGAEYLLFGSLGLLVWGVLFVGGNCLYIPLVEEPALHARFGKDYDVYKKSVPRWGWRWRR